MFLLEFNTTKFEISGITSKCILNDSYSISKYIILAYSFMFLFKNCL